MEARDYVTQLVDLRDKNTHPEGPRRQFSDNVKPKLSADVKKVTAFVKKVRQFSADGAKGLTDQLGVLNIKMFLSEIAQSVGPAVWEGKMKQADVPAFVAFLSHIHHSYDLATFYTEALQSFQQGFNIQGLIKELSTPLVEAPANKDTLASTPPALPSSSSPLGSALASAAAATVPLDIAKLRLGVRVMCEFWVTGWVPSTKFFNNFIGKIVSTLETDPKTRITSNAMGLVLLILKSVGVELLGSRYVGVNKAKFTYSEKKVDGSHIVVAEAAVVEEDEKDALKRSDPIYSKLRASDSEQKDLADKLAKLADYCLRYTGKVKRQVDARWRTLSEQAELHGQLSAEKRELFDAVQAEVERIIVLCENFTSAIGYPEGPARLELQAAAKSEGGSVVVLGSATQDFFSVKNAESINCFDSGKERGFYEEYPDLLDLITSVCPSVEIPKLVSAVVPAERTNDAAKEEDDDMEGVYVASSDPKGGKKPRMAVADDEDAPIQIHKVGEGGKSVETASFTELTAMLESLSQVSTSEFAEFWVMRFIAYALQYFTDPAVLVSDAQTFFALCRRRVVKHLRLAMNCGTQSLPYVARCVAILGGSNENNLIFAPAGSPTLGEFIAQKVEGELQHAIRAKTQTNGMRKQKAVRYLCELVKFRVCGPIRAIRVIQTCLVELEDNPHGVEAIVSLIETIGPFLFRGQVTKTRINDAVQQLADLIKKTAYLSEGAVDSIRGALAVYQNRIDKNGDSEELHRRCIPGYEYVFGVGGESPETVFERFLRHLMFTFVDSPQTAEVASHKLRKVAWLDKALPKGEFKYQKTLPPRPSEIAIRVFRSVKNVKWGSLPHFCTALAFLRNKGGLRFVLDATCASAFEDISRDLEVTSWHSGALIYAVSKIVESNIHAAAEKKRASESSSLSHPVAEPETPSTMGSSALRHLQSTEKQGSEPAASQLIKTSVIAALAPAKFQCPTVRPNLETTLDIIFLGEMFNWNVIGTSSMITLLCKILFFFPSHPGSASAKAAVKEMVKDELLGKLPADASEYGVDLVTHYISTSLPSDFQRIRWACAALKALVPYGLPVQDIYRNASTLSEAANSHLGVLKDKADFVLCIRVLLAHLFVMVHTRAAPFPTELQYELADVFQTTTAHLCADVGQLTFVDVLGRGHPVVGGGIFEGRLRRSILTHPTPTVTPTTPTTDASTSESGCDSRAATLTKENMHLFERKLNSQVKRRLFKSFSDKEWAKKTSAKRAEIKERVRQEILREGGPEKYKARDRAELAAILLGEGGATSIHKSAAAAAVSVPQYYFPTSLRCALGHLDRTLLIATKGTGDVAVVTDELGAFDRRVLPPTPTRAQLDAIEPMIALVHHLVLDDPQQVNPVKDAAQYHSTTSEEAAAAAAAAAGETEYEGYVEGQYGFEGEGCAASSSDAEESDEEDDESTEEDEEEGEDTAESPIEGEGERASDDDVDDFSSSSSSSSETESDTGPTMGFGAFRIKMGSTARERAGQSEEANELDKMMNAMILESTSKAMGQRRGGDTTAEMRLSGAFYSGAVKKIRQESVAAASSAAAAAESKPPSVAPNLAAFAFLKRGGKKAVATTLTVSADSPFVARVERNIEQSDADRLERQQQTMQLVKQQEYESKMEFLARGRELDMKEEEDRLVAEAKAKEQRMLLKRENQNLEKRRADNRKAEEMLLAGDKITKDDRIGSIRFGARK